jgi:DNA mismatch repair protein MutS2
VESRLAQLTAEVRETKKRALEEAGRILDGAHALIERTVRDIREREADRSVVKTGKEQVDLLRKEVVEEQRELSPAAAEVPATGTLSVGSRVRIAGSSAIGEVESLSPDGMTAMVALGSVRMKSRVSDLSVTAERVRPSALPEVVTASRTAPVQQELDLRGLTGDEALPMVDKFIDDAVLSGLTRLTIIHGKGTGALRKKVTEFLARHPRVQSAGLAEWNEGGTGATVVQLRES